MSARTAVRRGFLGGLAAFGIVAAFGIAIGLIEWAGSGGRYHAWTWVKVGFLYLLSSCGVGIRLVLTGARGQFAQELFRVPLLVGTFLILWAVARVTRRAIDDGSGGAAAAAAVALGFAIPGVAVAWLATLRFPSRLRVQLLVSPVRWQAVVLVPLVAGAGALLGVYLSRRRAWARRPAEAHLVAWGEGGTRMFAWALLLAFVGFLVLAAVRPTQTSIYVDRVRGWGRAGTFAAAHHLLLLPDQSVWLLAPSMGGTTEAHFAFGPDPRASLTVTLREVTYRPEPAGEGEGPLVRWHLDPAALLFLLVPAAATVLGGRAATAPRMSRIRRARRGAGSGVVFALLVTLAAFFTRSLVPVPPTWIPRVAVAVAMPSTALLALAWGVVGGAAGALSAGHRWPRADEAQEPAAPEPD